MPRSRAFLVVLLAALSVAVAGADAAADPKFEFSKPEEVKKVVWKVSMSGGAIVTTGNSTTTTLSGAAGLSRFDGRHKIAVDVAGAFARTATLVAIDYNGDHKIQPNEITSVGKISAQNWAAKLRYDLYITKSNALYINSIVAGDEPAGKKLFGGGQAGYARTFYKSDRHEVVGEIGYDFTYVFFVKQPTKDEQIHSARLFASWAVTIVKDTTASIGVEGLFNLNPLDTPTGKAQPFEGTRVNGKVSLATKLVENIGLRLNFTARYDNWPAPRPAFDIPYADGYVPAAEKLDTITDLSLTVSFL